MILTPEQQKKFDDYNRKFQWNDKWESFPNPEKNDYLNAPLGPGVYQIRTKDTHDYIMFGEGGQTLFRMLSLLPEPFYKGNRNNEDKKDYICDNIDNFEYRTLACSSKEEAVRIQNELKRLKIHKFNM